MPSQTAAERRKEAKAAYDKFMERCPKRQVLQLLGDKWVTLVLKALFNGPRRHGEMRREIAGVSQKMLTQTLRRLERDGLVTRTVTLSVPVRVDYALTSLGTSLEAEAQRLKAWAETNMPAVERARLEFSRRAAIAYAESEEEG